MKPNKFKHADPLRAAAYALDMNRVLRTETHTLGVYLRASSNSRLLAERVFVFGLRV